MPLPSHGQTPYDNDLNAVITSALNTATSAQSAATTATTTANAASASAAAATAKANDIATSVGGVVPTVINARDEAVAAAAAAKAVGSTNDAIISGRIDDPVSATHASLSAAFAPKAWVDTRPASMQKWRLAFAGVRNGGGIARILCVGDSTTGGYKLTGAFENLYAWPSRLASFIDATMGGIGAYGLGLPPIGTSTDTRWTLGTGWSLNTGYGFGNSGVYTGTNPAGSLVYADNRIIADRFDVYYHKVSGAGNLHITATGGVTTNVTCAGTAGVYKVTVNAATAVTTNTLTITADGGGLVNVVGIEPWNSVGTKVIIGNAGRNGTTSVEWGVDTLGLASLASIQAYAPALTILSIGINDGNPLNLPSVATYKANVGNIITAARVSGDVLIWIPFTQGIYDATVQTYRVALTEVAAANNVPIIDMQARFGDYATSADARAWFADAQHLAALGHLDMAFAFLDYLNRLG